MSDKYVRVGALRAKLQVNQGDYLYAPLATAVKAGIVTAGDDTLTIVKGKAVVNVDKVSAGWFSFEEVL